MSGFQDILQAHIQLYLPFWSLSQEDPLEKEMATHSSILAWRIPWAEDSDELQSMGLQRVEHDWATNTYLSGHLTLFQWLCNSTCLTALLSS